MTIQASIHGHCEDRFNHVQQAFADNFSDNLELGASLAITLNGQPVVDLWGGYADVSRSRSWEQDTLINAFSISKSMLAVCVLLLAERNQLKLDAPVARYWPGFGQAGKEKLQVRHILSHSAGLPGWDKPVAVETMYDWDTVTNLLAEQKPWWEPGTRCGYHSASYGFLLGEIIKRITGTSPGAFLREEIAKPLGAEFYIGLPEECEPRLAELSGEPPEYEGAGNIITKKTFENPAGSISLKHINTRAWRAAELPAQNGYSNARSAAAIFAPFVCGGEYNGVKLFSNEILKLAVTEQIYAYDLVIGSKIRWGTGWSLQSQEAPIGASTNLFWWGGAGGSLVIADVDAGMSFAYMVNNMNGIFFENERVTRILKAVYSSLYFK